MRGNSGAAQATTEQTVTGMENSQPITGKMDMLANIPEELRQERQWLIWKSVPVPGKPKPNKVPMNPSTGHPAATNNPRTWNPFEDAVEFYSEWAGFEHSHVDGKTGAVIEGKIKGVGFVFSRDDDYVGIDLDNCVNDSGTLQSWAADIVESIKSYTEFSPSRTGLHIITKGAIPSCFKNGNVEAYDHGRYFTFTGDVYQNRGTIHKLQKQLTAFHQKYSGKTAKVKKSHVPLSVVGMAAGTLDSSAVLERAFRSKKGEQIRAMLGDDLCGHPSASERDLALCGHLVWFCGNVPDGEKFRVVDQIIRENAVFRDKWDAVHRPVDNATYGRMTIETAIAGTKGCYQSRNDRSLKDTESTSDAMGRADLSIQDIISAAYDDQKGCADLFIQLNKGLFCYDHAADLWYRFEGHHWMSEDIGEPVKAVDHVQILFQQAAAEIGGEVIITAELKKNTPDEVEQEKLNSRVKSLQVTEKNLKALIKKLSALHFRKQVVEFSAQGSGTLGINGAQWDGQPWALACKNGIVDLKSGELRIGRPEDYIKSPCPTEYKSNAECPRFHKFLSEIFGEDQGLVAFVQRVIGMGLIGSSFQKQYLIVLSGQGRNGKDTLLSIVGHVLGSHLAGPIAPEMLLDNGKFGHRSSSGPSPDIMRLRGLRIAWASETSQGRRFDAGKAKMITGGGSVVGRPPYGRHEIEFEQSHLIFLLTNSRPHAPVDDYAFWKRICNIPFTQSFVDDPQASNEHKVDKDILAKMGKEAPGILRWMVEGCLAYQRDGLNQPEAVQRANEDYRRSEDTLQDFIDDKCFVDQKESCRASSLYQRYKSWASDGGSKPMSQTAFGQQMAQRGFVKRRSNGWIYDGIGLTVKEQGCLN